MRIENTHSGFSFTSVRLKTTGRKWKRRNDHFKGTVVFSGISVPQIHNSVAVNLIKYWTCTDGVLDLLWERRDACICSNSWGTCLCLNVNVQYSAVSPVHSGWRILCFQHVWMYIHAFPDMQSSSESCEDRLREPVFLRRPPQLNRPS